MSRLLVAVGAVVLLASACSSEPLDGARGAWAEAKSSCSTYSYLREFQSVFGLRERTWVEVMADAPTRRHFVTSNINDAPAEWDETGAAIGSHDRGYPAETVEQLHSECATILGADPKSYTFTFETDARGIPTTCIQTLKGAADDTSSGIWIGAFTCAPLAADGQLAP